MLVTPFTTNLVKKGKLIPTLWFHWNEKIFCVYLSTLGRANQPSLTGEYKPVIWVASARNHANFDWVTKPIKGDEPY